MKTITHKPFLEIDLTGALHTHLDLPEAAVELDKTFNFLNRMFVMFYVLCNIILPGIFCVILITYSHYISPYAMSHVVAIIDQQKDL